MADEKADAAGDTKKVILNLLLEGSKTAGDIADKLQIQKSAVRVHLESMQKERMVKSYFRMERLGRPRRVYELSENGRELFPRKYDLMLSLILKKVEETSGHEQLKKLIESVADDMAEEIREKIKKNNSLNNFEESLKILDSVSNSMGFVSSIIKESNKTYSLVSRNCVLHKVAVDNHDVICHGLHDRLIHKALDGKVNPEVQLKECIALGDEYSRHIISTNK